MQISEKDVRVDRLKAAKARAERLAKQAKIAKAVTNQPQALRAA